MGPCLRTQDVNPHRIAVPRVERERVTVSRPRRMALAVTEVSRYEMPAAAVDVGAFDDLAIAAHDPGVVHDRQSRHNLARRRRER